MERNRPKNVVSCSYPRFNGWCSVTLVARVFPQYSHFRYLSIDMLVPILVLMDSAL